MPRFNYMARDSGGAGITGELVATSNADAIRLLRGEGKFVVQIREMGDYEKVEAVIPAIGGSRVKTDEIVYFLNQLAAMVDTGVSIADALEASIDKAPPGPFRRTIEDVIQRVQAGSDFSSALRAHPKVFPPLLIQMVKASEATGTLGEMLCRVAEYMVEQRDLLKRIKGALAYPLCMLVFALGATIFLLTFVLPKFASIYSSRQAVLPLPTRILMGTATWMSGHWISLLAGTVAAVVGTVLFFRSTKGGWTADWIRINLPVIGRMFRKAYLSRALRTLGTMISAGVSVLDAVMITRDVVGNRMFGEVFDGVRGRLEEGEQLSQTLLGAPFFPRPIWQMISSGERTGNLGPAMQRVADLCESDLRHTIRTTTQFIEPAMIVVMGTVIGTIALAILLPIFQISKVLTQ